MIELIKEYFEREFEDVERVITKKVFWAKPSEVKFNAIQRCLGVAMFAQSIEGITYEMVEPLFEDVKARIMNVEESDFE